MPTTILDGETYPEALHRRYADEEKAEEQMKTPHKHAELIHAWAEGAEIQVREKSGWKDMQQVIWLADREYRIKPAEKVVRWQWIVKPNKGGHRGQPELTQRFYKDEKTLTRDMGSLFDVIGKAEWTRTEFEQ